MPVLTPAVKRLTRLVLGTFLLSGCVLFRPPPPQGLEVNLRKATMDTEQFGELQLDGVFVVKNPNRFDVEVTETESTLRVEAKPVRVHSDNLTRLVPANGEIEIPARMAIQGAEVIAALGRQPEEESVESTLQLAVRSNHRELEPNRWYSAEWHGNMLVMLPPTLKFLGVEKESLSALQADLHLLLELDNPNNYQIDLRSISLDVKINGVAFGLIKSSEIDKIIGGQEKVELKVSQSYRLTTEENEIYSVLAHAESLHVEVSGTAILAFDSPLSPANAKLNAAGTVTP